MKTLLEWTVRVKGNRFYNIKGVYSYISFYTRPSVDIKDADISSFSFEVLKEHIYSYALDSRFILLSDKRDFSDYKCIVLNLDYCVVRIDTQTDWDDDYVYHFWLYTEKGKYKLRIVQIYPQSKSEDSRETVAVISLNPKIKELKIKNPNLRWGNTEFFIKIYDDFGEVEIECWKELVNK